MTERRQAEAEVERLADEQAALRRVATLVARDASQAELFTAIAEECAQLFALGTSGWSAMRTTVTSRARERGYVQESLPAGLSPALGGENAASRVFRTGQPARIDDYERASGPIAEAVRRPAFAAPWPPPSWLRAGFGAR